jgi:hypothetical protein
MGLPQLDPVTDMGNSDDAELQQAVAVINSLEQRLMSNPGKDNSLGCVSSVLLRCVLLCLGGVVALRVCVYGESAIAGFVNFHMACLLSFQLHALL